MHGVDYTMTCRRMWTLPLAVLLLSGICLTVQLRAEERGKYADPTRFEKEIQAFEAQDARQPPPRQAVLCVGSSTMRMWHADIRHDLAPLTVIARGFGGSTMYDLLHFTDRIVTVYQPRNRGVRGRQ